MTHALATPPPPRQPDYRFLVSVIVAMVLAGLNVVQVTAGDVPVPTFPVAPPTCSPPSAPAGTPPHPPVIYDQDGEPANEDDAP